MKTAEETWFDNTGSSINQEEYTAMIEFAKMHVEQALKKADITAEVFFPEGAWDDIADKDFIINSYPLENIK